MTLATRSLLVGCVISCAGCLPPRLLASRDVPHIVAEETTVVGWCRAKTGNVEKCKVELLPGDVVAPQEILRLEVVPPTSRVSHGE